MWVKVFTSPRSREGKKILWVKFQKGGGSGVGAPPHTRGQTENEDKTDRFDHLRYAWLLNVASFGHINRGGLNLNQFAVIVHPEITGTFQNKTIPEAQPLQTFVFRSYVNEIQYIKKKLLEFKKFKNFIIQATTR